MPATATRYDEGEEVATPDGPGVVAAVVTDPFEFPQGDDELVTVDASDDQPAYVVGLQSVGSAAYPASSLESTSLGEAEPGERGDSESDDVVRDPGGEPDRSEVDALTDVVDEDVDALDGLPDGWDRESVLEYWSSIGGSWEDCTADLTDEFEEERAKEHCSAMKDEVLRSTRWRNRF